MVGEAKQKERRLNVEFIRGMCRGCLSEERIACVLLAERMRSARYEGCYKARVLHVRVTNL